MVLDDAPLPIATPPAEQNKGETLPDATPVPPATREIGGPAGLEPTRYGDWERKGRCIDF